MVDVYDALCTERPYKPAFEREKALAILDEESGRGWYDSKVIEKFAELDLEE